jgi:hypothetical protein
MWFTYYQVFNGVITKCGRFVTADEATKFCTISMAIQNMPHWRIDPTYDMRRKK